MVQRPQVFVGITGASGHAYARSLLRSLLAGGAAVDLAVTSAGALVLAHEESVTVDDEGRIERAELARWLGVPEQEAERITSFGRGEVGARPASGAAACQAVILCPTSMGTLARVAAGFSSNLVERAADVALKEGRTLVLVPRESPLSQIHLLNMLRLSRLGAVILPAAPGFYHLPRSIDELVAQVVGKILRRVGLDADEGLAWSGLEADEEGAEGLGEPPPEEGLA